MESTNLPMRTVQCYKYHMQIKKTFPPRYNAGTEHADKDIHFHRGEQMSWRTLNRTMVTAAVHIHTYSLGQRECDLQALPLSRRRKKWDRTTETGLDASTSALSKTLHASNICPKWLFTPPKGDN